MSRPMSETTKWEPCPCAAAAIQQWWPGKMDEKVEGFARRMRDLQIALIECHLPAMAPDNAARATRTLAWLRSGAGVTP